MCYSLFTYEMCLHGECALRQQTCAPADTGQSAIGLKIVQLRMQACSGTCSSQACSRLSSRKLPCTRMSQIAVSRQDSHYSASSSTTPQPVEPLSRARHRGTHANRLHQLEQLQQLRRQLADASAFFDPPAFQPEKLRVSYLGGTSSSGPLPPFSQRCYTLTHNDVTAALTLTVGPSFNEAQIAGFYTRLLRDEVTAEWQQGPHGVPQLHVFVHLSGQERWIAPPELRNYIFRRELPLVLETFLYADRDMLVQHPHLAAAPVVVHFESHVQALNVVEEWGVFANRASWQPIPTSILLRLLSRLVGMGLPPQFPWSRPVPIGVAAFSGLISGVAQSFASSGEQTGNRSGAEAAGAVPASVMVPTAVPAFSTEPAIIPLSALQSAASMPACDLPPLVEAPTEHRHHQQQQQQEQQQLRPLWSAPYSGARGSSAASLALLDVAEHAALAVLDAAAASSGSPEPSEMSVTALNHNTNNEDSGRPVMTVSAPSAVACAGDAGNIVSLRRATETRSASLWLRKEVPSQRVRFPRQVQLAEQDASCVVAVAGSGRPHDLSGAYSDVPLSSGAVDSKDGSCVDSAGSSDSDSLGYDSDSSRSAGISCWSRCSSGITSSSSSSSSSSSNNSSQLVAARPVIGARR